MESLYLAELGPEQGAAFSPVDFLEWIFLYYYLSLESFQKLLFIVTSFLCHGVHPPCPLPAIWLNVEILQFTFVF